MQDDYSWNGGLRGTSSFRLPESEGQGKWVLISLLVAVFLHALVLVGLSRINVILPEFIENKDLQTEVVRVNRVDLDDSRPEINKPEAPEVEAPIPPEVVPPADELDILENLPEMDIDISPDIEKIEAPTIKSAVAGELEGEVLDSVKNPVFEPELPEMGTTEDFFPRANEGQVTVDPGARLTDTHDPDAYMEKLRKGAQGESEDGLLKGFTTLDDMANMDGTALLQSKALIGSDLLFEFNSAELRQSARVSLMKVALLIHKHPDLVCWVDGHTDLIGGEAPNMELSRRRAMSVKRWLVESMDLDGKQIAVRGFGKQQPLVKAGTVKEQAPNRRVEIKMRKQRPEDEWDGKTTKVVQSPNTPKKDPVANPPKPPKKTPPKAIVEPEEEPTNRAQVVPEDDDVVPLRKAIPVPE